MGVGPGNFGEYRSLHVDGSTLSPHNLLGQSLAETGLLGISAFIVLVVAILGGCRTMRSLSRGIDDSNLLLMAGLAVACRNSVLLLFVEGIAGHNLYRYNWLWLAAFVALATKFAAAMRYQQCLARRNSVIPESAYENAYGCPAV